MFKEKLNTLDIVHCSLFTALIAIGAFIKIMIPLGVFEVTFSLQLLFSLLAGIVLGSKKGFISVLIYLTIGLIGIPIFAHGGGLAYILRPTFGFLIGFAFSALLAGRFREKFGKATFTKLLFACFIGEMAYYLCGLVYYFVSFNYILSNGMSIGLVELISVWFLSTVGPDFILCIIAANIGNRLLPILNKIKCNKGE
ncbi:biotin transporter BioY [Peptostreptococcus equinus]|uniref:Biotin transporter n=1 Tax=Peptostreptococcus equinus TaxID=3003601 RepID=A0ABY7JPZ0_9FIRM|nr:biotin transporter BioY [Peptostreptococcus sp. CBA3647]WAW14566.1 biotin transporter BioY [Peptostreptococcus sp. CBA3647]